MKKFVDRCRFLLTYAAGGGAWPGAVGLAQSDAGTLEVEVRKASNAAGCIEVIITHILDEKAVLWRGQRWTVYNWDKRTKDNDIKTNVMNTVSW